MAIVSFHEYAKARKYPGRIIGDCEHHLTLLRKGVDVWNEWRKNNPHVLPNFRRASLKKFCFCGANLTDADFSQAFLLGSCFGEADLRDADFEEANLREAYFGKADLRWANFSEADLNNVNFREANLRETEFAWTQLCLANLRDADLTEANLSYADLTEANLTQANLTQVNLIGVRALYANFEGAILTGACLLDWHTNNATNLDGVICDYVHLDVNPPKRCPERGNFEPGEFTQLFKTDVANRLVELTQAYRKNQPNYTYELVVDRLESRTLLRGALNCPAERLILVCPWLCRKSIQSDIFRMMRAFLEKGGCIHMGWGSWNDLKNKVKLHDGLRTRKQLINSSEGWKYDAVSQSCTELYSLEKLELDYPNQFKLKLLGTHEKYLVWVNSDNSWVMIGSHNFLTSSDINLKNYYTGNNYISLERELGLKTNNIDIVDQVIKHFDNSRNWEE